MLMWVSPCTVHGPVPRLRKIARPLEPGGDGPGRDCRGQSGFAAAGVFTESRACLGSTLQLCPAKEIRCNRSRSSASIRRCQVEGMVRLFSAEALRTAGLAD